MTTQFAPENSTCIFSDDERYRYVLTHRFDLDQTTPIRAVAWIGLNPSTANPISLDPTLRRVRAFSHAWGYNAFHMLNLFAFRATDPREMMTADEPKGRDNLDHITRIVQSSELVIAAWGVHGEYGNQGKMIAGHIRLCKPQNPLMCLGKTKVGFPRHPLYVAANTPLIPF